MTIQLDVQVAAPGTGVPVASVLRSWAARMPSFDSNNSVCLRVVGGDEARRLNRHFRGINQATNVLSFPADIPKELGINFLGDVVICAPIAIQEAQAQKKDAHSHWAHLLVHGILHLQGYDHAHNKQAEEMEALEIEILKLLGMQNPY